MFLEQIPASTILFFILYGITGVVPLIAAIYLLLRRGNAFAPDVTPPLRLRRWAASFFAVAALSHVWWYLFYIFSLDIRSVWYIVIALLDCMMLFTTIAGTLLAMLQDRKRSVWPTISALLPFVVLVVLQKFYPEGLFMKIAVIYIISLYAIFSVYMVFAVRSYGRWLNDNYADLENKKVWLSQIVSLFCLLLFILYALVDNNSSLVFLLHVVSLVLFILLLWRVETLPQLDSILAEEACEPPVAETAQEPDFSLLSEQPSVIFSYIEQLLTERCADTQLYLQHDLTVLQLAKTIGTNRSYLSQYFSSRGTTYNAYINDLRINHFMRLYREIAKTGKYISAQQLANDSGYRSYSTFSLAFKQRVGQNVKVWMRETAM